MIFEKSACVFFLEIFAPHRGGSPERQLSLLLHPLDRIEGCNFLPFRIAMHGTSREYFIDEHCLDHPATRGAIGARLFRGIASAIRGVCHRWGLLYDYNRLNSSRCAGQDHAELKSTSIPCPSHDGLSFSRNRLAWLDGILDFRFAWRDKDGHGGGSKLISGCGGTSCE